MGKHHEERVPETERHEECDGTGRVWDRDERGRRIFPPDLCEGCKGKGRVTVEKKKGGKEK